MVVDDYEAIIQWHPQMILISKKPVTWKGFLTVSCNSNTGQNMRIKLRLVAPNYPSLNDAEVNFGKEISFIRKEGFSQKVKDLARNVTKASLFLSHLQTLIGIQILSGNSLNTIKLSLENVAVELQRTKYGTYPWTVIYSDLPEIPAFGPFEKNLSTLAIARNKFKLQVEILKETWSNLKKIDKNCWIVDPLQPKPCHLYRRIYLTPSLSMLIKISPLNPMDLPEIKFMGSDIEVESMRNIVSKNLHNWNPKCDIIDNLLMLLNRDIFPKKEKEKYIENNGAIVTDEECCICFSMKLDNETLPEKICNNEKCRRHFHTSCLLQWLQAVAGNHVVFDYIHGTCPNCQESISCCIK
ncbi:PREDICTED: E3 ubiquitin-protein ligase FANCL [Habropoda laboriosa]|uniref:E3 ubiquitin-protein ligase FANCL n=1 Tax=Habropoda laboriosa TaxID=597456 RepID=UPI00083D2D68|nr:PREDICTED: E3 ubiquitin-protein ligase FANCL [Habropoda laboriosa]